MGYIEGLLGKNESIVIRTRQHWMVLAKSFVVNVILAILIPIAAIALSAFLAPTGLGAIGLLVLLLLILPGVFFLRDYLVWWNEEYLVTNHRVIQAEGVINKHVIDSSLEKVNDVVLDQSFLGRMFDYGDIEIMTASESGINKLQRIAQPIKFKTEMLNQKSALGANETRRPGLPVDIPGLIAELDSLRQRGVLTDAEFAQKKAELLAKM